MDALSMDELRDRPTVTVPEAGAVLGLSRNSAYKAARQGEIPTLRVGSRLVVPTARLIRLLEGEHADDAA